MLAATKIERLIAKAKHHSKSSGIRSHQKCKKTIFTTVFRKIKRVAFIDALHREVEYRQIRYKINSCKTQFMMREDMTNTLA
jgi:hypothetical protein